MWQDVSGETEQRPFSWFEHSEATQLLYPGSLQVWDLEHQGILSQDNITYELKHFTPNTLLLIVKSLTSSSQRGMMISHSASHHAESNSTKILLFVPKPNLWMECNLWRGRGGENSVWWCFFRKPERIERKNKSYTQCTGKYLILLLLAFLSVWCWHSKIHPKLCQHKQVEPQVSFLNWQSKLT